MRVFIVFLLFVAFLIFMTVDSRGARLGAYHFNNSPIEGGAASV